MKAKIYPPGVFTSMCCSAWSMIAFCLIPAASSSQAATIVSPVTNQAYKLPAPASLQTAADAQGAITAAETAGKTLNADADKERATTQSQENEYDKAQAINNAYILAVNNFSKNDVAPYTADLNNYTASGTKFNELLSSYNKAATANNALAAKDRKAATVATLNKQKTQIDAWGAKLTQWKTKLDAAKAKLDVKNAALQKQKQTYDTSNKSASGKLLISRKKLEGLLEQLTICSNYAAKCRALLVGKFNINTADTGYFAGAIFKEEISKLSTDLEKLKHLPGMVWDAK